MEAGELTEGYYVENAKGELLLLSKVEEEYLKNPVTVYNFEVEDWHTYYVSGEEIFVHNKCSTVKDTSNVPNPHGKKGGEKHQAGINAIQPYNGGDLEKEVKFKTPKGEKNYRYADAVEMVDNQIVSIHQVGLINQNGLPVARESKAIADIMGATNYSGAPIYFWPYNANTGPIIYEY